MEMPQKLMGNLGASCVLSFMLAVWAFTSGLGFIAAFLIYSLGGAIMMLGLSALTVALSADEEVEPEVRQEVLA